jgi:diguanylate cyclase (GGDEF)-like protein
MQLERLSKFVEEVKRELGKNFVALKVYSKRKVEWYGPDNILLEDKNLALELEATLGSGEAWRARKSCNTFYPVKALSTVLVVETAAPRRKQTRESFMAAIVKCLDHSTDAFEASHDRLTGLLDGKSFEKAVHVEMESISGDPEGGGEPPGYVANESRLAVMALDIDHFKQVNDTHGHLYGDLVLRCLARRLERVGATISSESQGRLRACVGRPSGEEFLICVTGVGGAEEGKEMAERFRREIGDCALPLNDEVENCGGAVGVTLPDMRLRKITVSIGIALLDKTAEASTDTIRKLRGYADLALLRAKAEGRDRVCVFDQIMQGHGRVLEYHKDTGVITIDIGRIVGGTGAGIPGLSSELHWR